MRTMLSLGPSPSSPPNSSLTLRIHYFKDEQTSGYYHQFRGTNVQIFNNSTVMFLKDAEQINGLFSSFSHIRSISSHFSTDYLRTTGQMIVSILNHYAQKSINLHEKPLHR